VIRIGDWFPPGAGDLDRWGIVLALAAAIRSLGLRTDDFRPYSFTTSPEQAGSGSVLLIEKHPVPTRLFGSKYERSLRTLREETAMSVFWGVRSDD
jgi:hypothetical protein